jgi:hypothetical protein
MNEIKLLRPAQAAEFLQSRFGFGSVRSLAKLRCVGGGPAFRRIGNRMIGYTESDLLTWGLSRVSGPLASTSVAA